MRNRLIVFSLGSALAVAPLVGCEQLPGDEKTQGAVIGGVGGAAAGAMLGGDDNRLLGALIGGALGAGGGYLIGGQLDKNEDDARDAARRARENPATVEDVRDARDADVNRDGFVSLDEVVAMERAGLSNREMIDRLGDTGQVFVLTEEQEDYLSDRGVDEDVIREMRDLNRDKLRATDRDRDRAGLGSSRISDRD